MDKNFLRIMLYLIICILIGSVVNESNQILFLKNKNSNIIKEIDNKKVENKILKAELELLDKDMRYITILARKDLGMIKHGEKIYRFNN
jgi:cell division protein FtsB